MKKILMLTYLLLFFFQQVQSQTSDTIYLWSGKVPGSDQVLKAPVVSENNSGDVIRIAEVSNPMMIHFPAKTNDKKVSMIVCPGGGYHILAVNIEGTEIATWLNEQGISAYVLYYRVPNNQAGALQDVQRAIRLVKTINADHQVGVMGFSAGGSLTARAACLAHRKSYEAADANDTISPLPDFAALIYPAYLDQGENRSLTPEFEITDATPPIFIFGTADDSYGNSALVMTTALRDSKRPVNLHFMDKGGHGYGLRPGNLAGETWPLLMKEWLEHQITTMEEKN
jgi:acetyl esterase/lipase